ncbi:Helix-turn-helix [Bradyrhizobium erythrophlei]|nr:Helix-turn-helix [Bradyrhizobium erythrophlei]
MTITGMQIRAARAALKWTLADLAKTADVGDSTIRSIESSDGEPVIRGGGVDQTLEYRAAARSEALAKIVAALEKAGIKFLPANAHGPGIRGRVD